MKRVIDGLLAIVLFVPVLALGIFLAAALLITALLKRTTGRSSVRVGRVRRMQ